MCDGEGGMVMCDGEDMMVMCDGEAEMVMCDDEGGMVICDGEGGIVMCDGEGCTYNCSAGIDEWIMRYFTGALLGALCRCTCSDASVMWCLFPCRSLLQ